MFLVSLIRGIHLNRYLVILLAQILTVSVVCAENSKENLEILSIHSYHQEYPWTSSQYDSFKENLRKSSPNYKINFSSEYLNTKRISPSDSYKENFLLYLKEKYKSHPPQLIYATDDNALTFLHSESHHFPWGAPIVFSGLNNSKVYESLAHDPITGVFEQKNIIDNINLARNLEPDSNHVIFVGDSGATDMAIRATIEEIRSSVKDVELILVGDPNIESLLNRVTSSEQGVIILTSIGAMHNDQGNFIDLQKTIGAIARTGRKVLVMEDAYLYPGAIGGYVTSSYLHGKNAALLASRIISGESVLSITPISDSLSQLVLRWPEMKRLNIHLEQSTLYNAKVIEQPKSLIELYPSILKWLLILLAFLVVIILGFIINTRQNKRLLKEQTTDSLTGLPNRTRLLHDIQSKDNPGLAIVDINNFKLINTLYGLKTGDNLLIVFGHYLAKSISKQCQLYRLDGDQFGILSDISSSTQDFDLSIKKLLKKINDNSFQLDQLDVQLTLTAGISRYDSEFIIPRAEQALQQAKKNNVGYCIIDPDLMGDEESSQQNMLWAHKLGIALKEQRVIPYYQPIVNNRTGVISKHEALVRLIDKDNSVVPPSFFLDAAKSTRQYSALTHAMIEHSLKTAQKHQSSISINFTVEDIRNDKTISFFKEKAIEYNIADKLVIELTESEGIENYKEVSKFITDIKKLGCRIAIDDFGTGYSNFTHLIHLNVDYLKIDGSIISSITTDKNSEIVARTLVDFAERLNIETIAEFVDSQEVLDKVNELGIHYSQGYFLGKPAKELAK